MRQYLDLVQHVLDNGVEKQDRTGTGTLSVFGYQMRFDLQKGFPLLTTKKLHWKSICHETLWFLIGDTNIKYLTDNGVTIWNEWANENGDCPNIYPKQWIRHTNLRFSHAKTSGDCYVNLPINQISEVINSIKTNPDSRRHIVSAWNVAEIDRMALPPCHLLFQFYVANNKLSCQLYQRKLRLMFENS